MEKGELRVFLLASLALGLLQTTEDISGALVVCLKNYIYLIILYIYPRAFFTNFWPDLNPAKVNFSVIYKAGLRISGGESATDEFWGILETILGLLDFWSSYRFGTLESAQKTFLNSGLFLKWPISCESPTIVGEP
jgi:hypothetical protein